MTAAVDPELEARRMARAARGRDANRELFAAARAAAEDRLRGELEETQANIARRALPASLPEFPVRALGARLAQYVEAVAAAYQVPVGMVAMLALATLAAAVAKRFAVRVREAWVEALTLYVLVAMLPGERKTRTLAELAAPLDEWERRHALELAPEIASAQRARADAEARAQALRTRAARAPHAKRAGAQHELEDAYAELDAIEVPVAPRVRIDDATPEAIGRVLAANGGRIAALASEGGFFETLGGRYSDGVPNLDLILKAWDGAEPWRRDRASGESVRVEAPIVTLGLCVQPDVLAALAAKRGFRGRGLIGRFLYWLPESRMGSREIEPPPIPERLRSWWRGLLLDLLDAPDERIGRGEIETREIDSSPEARAALLDFARELEPRLGPDGDLRPMSDWAAKLAGETARVAGLLHVAGGAHNLGQPVPAEAMDRAVTIARDLVPHARAALALMGELEDESGLDGETHELIGWIQRHGGRTSARALGKGPQRYRAPGAAAAALERLVELGLGSWTLDREPGGRGPLARAFVLAEDGGTGGGGEFVAGDPLGLEPAAAAAPPTPNGHHADPEGGRIEPSAEELAALDDHAREERAAIHEHEAGLPRDEAERRALEAHPIAEATLPNGKASGRMAL